VGPRSDGPVTNRVSSVALVDDDGSVRVALARLLRLAGYEVKPFGSGAEFITSLGVCRPDCVVLDVHLPFLSGFDVSSWMETAGIQVPIVFITASDDAGLDAAVAEANGVRLLRKPLSKRDLLGAVNNALRGRGTP
jgi:FixJ family two-component response regulator